MEHKIKTPCELEVTVIADVSPSVPPVPCMDPDHPAYSDPGDPGGASISAVLLTNLKTGEFIDITDCLGEQELQDLADAVLEDAEETFGE